MKVWVVSAYESEEYFLVGVFDSEDKAAAALARDVHEQSKTRHRREHWVQYNHRTETFELNEEHSA